VLISSLHISIPHTYLHVYIYIYILHKVGRKGRMHSNNEHLNIPSPLTVHPMSMASGPAVTAVFWGKENAPAPMTLPTTRSTNSLEGRKDTKKRRIPMRDVKDGRKEGRNQGRTDIKEGGCQGRKDTKEGRKEEVVQ
jgi:hypothetical protein